MTGRFYATGALQPDLLSDESGSELESVVDSRRVQREEVDVPQVLIKWKGRAVNEALCLDVIDVRWQFLEFRLEDNAVSNSGAVYTDHRFARIYKGREKLGTGS